MRIGSANFILGVQNLQMKVSGDSDFISILLKDSEVKISGILISLLANTQWLKWKLGALLISF